MFYVYHCFSVSSGGGWLSCLKVWKSNRREAEISKYLAYLLEKSSNFSNKLTCVIKALLELTEGMQMKWIKAICLKIFLNSAAVEISSKEFCCYSQQEQRWWWWTRRLKVEQTQIISLPFIIPAVTLKLAHTCSDYNVLTRLMLMWATASHM